MSEFECRLHHPMRAGQLVCWCGERLTYMDGDSRNELRREAKREMMGEMKSEGTTEDGDD